MTLLCVFLEYSAENLQLLGSRVINYSIMLADAIQAYILCLLQPLEYIVSVFLSIFYIHIELKLLNTHVSRFCNKSFVHINNVVALVNIFFFNCQAYSKIKENSDCLSAVMNSGC